MTKNLQPEPAEGYKKAFTPVPLLPSLPSPSYFSSFVLSYFLSFNQYPTLLIWCQFLFLVIKMYYLLCGFPSTFSHHGNKILLHKFQEMAHSHHRCKSVRKILIPATFLRCLNLFKQTAQFFCQKVNLERHDLVKHLRFPWFLFITSCSER